MTMSTSKRVAMYVLPVVILSIALNIPKVLIYFIIINKINTRTLFNKGRSIEIFLKYKTRLIVTLRKIRPGFFKSI